MSETYVLNATSGKYTIFKDPDATLDYSIDWTDWMADDDTITTLLMIATSPLVVASQGIVSVLADPLASPAVPAQHVTTAFLSGGLVANPLLGVTFRITTAQGRTEDRTVYLKIKER